MKHELGIQTRISQSAFQLLFLLKIAKELLQSDKRNKNCLLWVYEYMLKVNILDQVILSICIAVAFFLKIRYFKHNLVNLVYVQVHTLIFCIYE